MIQAKYKAISLDELQKLVNSKSSLSEVLFSLGYINTSVATRLRDYLIENNIDFSHFKGQAWNRKQEYRIEENEFNTSNTITIKYKLIEERGHKCENCGNSVWEGELIPLELHHNDGNSKRNIRVNLKLLCPNCHALTKNYCGRHKTNNYVSDKDFLQVLLTESSICAACRKINLEPNQANYSRAKNLLKNRDIL